MRVKPFEITYKGTTDVFFNFFRKMRLRRRNKKLIKGVNKNHVDKNKTDFR